MKHYRNNAPLPVFDRFDICAAHLLIEHDYNVRGIYKYNRRKLFPHQYKVYMGIKLMNHHTTKFNHLNSYIDFRFSHNQNFRALHIHFFNSDYDLMR